LHSDVKIICTASSGFDNIDIKACRELEIKTINVYGGNAVSAAEHTFAFILGIFKNIIHNNQRMKLGIFDNASNINTELYGKTIGIIGVGRIGARVAEYARAFGMKVAGNDINPKLKNRYKWIKFMSLNRLLKQSDVVTVHTPLDESTYHLIDKNNIRLLKKNAVIINCARGGIIDEQSLIDALKKNKIFYAGIDVFENEPKFNKHFAKLNNVILSPHLAGKTSESKKRMAVMAAENILKELK
jgi:D-3-phosphoglycerate dehydrogenase